MTSSSQPPATVSATECRKVRIVVADDSEVTLKTVSEFLNAHPELCVAGIAHDGHEAIAQVELLQPDLVLMDIQMPVLNGLRATEELRKEFPDLPVVLMSVHDSESWRQAAEESGAKKFISKRELALRLPELLRRWFGISMQGETSTYD